MSSQANLDKMGERQNFRNLWHSDLVSTLQADPPYCVFATCCPPCASYLLRRRALYGDMSRYTCCAGYLPCSGKCGERKCPEFCLFTEVFLCFGNSVASTRWLLQDEFNIQTTKCDNCIIGFMICLQQLACIFSIVALISGIDEINEASQLLSCLSHMVYCTVCACMQTQHKIEMDKRDGKFGPQRVMGVPAMQQMSRMDQGVPPPVGYPGPHHAYAAPPPAAYYPPSSNHPPANPPGYYVPPSLAGYPPPGNPHPQQHPYPHPHAQPYPPPQQHPYPPQQQHPYPPQQPQPNPPQQEQQPQPSQEGGVQKNEPASTTDSENPKK